MDPFDAASSNRAASYKFFSQLVQSSRLPSSPSDPPPTMLHRSPSGAKRKIRQKAEKESRPSPFLQQSPSSSSIPSVSSSPSAPSPSLNSLSPSPSLVSSSTPSPAPSVMEPPPTRRASSNYRGLIESCDYESILPELNTFSSPPVPAPRLHVPFSSSMCQLDRVGTSSSPVPSSLPLSSVAPSTSTLPPSPLDPLPSNPLPPSKPTVEVHPMPSKREKPAVPAKPRGLKLIPPESPVGSSPSPTRTLNRWSSTSCLMSPSALSSSPLSTSSLFINQLFSSPSFANLTSAYHKTTDLDEREKEDLENRRMESLCSLSTRVARLQEELSLLHKEMEVNDESGMSVLDIVRSRQPALHDKVRRHLEHEKELIGLETKLRLQLDKCTRHIRDDLTDRQFEAEQEESRLRGKLKETRLLRSIYSNREREVERALGSLLSHEENRRWTAYKESFCKMIEESRQIEFALNDAKLQLRALHSVPRPRAVSPV